MQRKKGDKNGKSGCVYKKYNCKSHLSNQATSRRVPFKKNQELPCQTKRNSSFFFLAYFGA